MTTVVPPPSQNDAGERTNRRQARLTFIVLLGINILNYADRSVLSAVQTKIQLEFGLNNSELGALTSSFLLIYAVATLPLGVWADKSVRKNIVAACVGIWSVATLLTGITRNFMQIFISRSFLGIGEAGYAPASLSLIGDLFGKEQRGRILSLWSLGNLVGTALGLAAGGIIADKFGWRWAFYVVGIPGLIAAFLIWRASEPKRGVFDQGSDASSTHGSIGKDFWVTVNKILRIPTYWVLLGAFVFSFFTIGSAQAWMTTYLVRDFALSVAKAGVYSGATLAGGSLVGILIGGWLADVLQRRIPQGRMLVTAISFLIGAPFTFVALSIHALVPFLSFFTLSIIFLSLSLGPLNAIVQDVIAPNIRATAIGLVLLMAHLLGDASSPYIVGLIADRSSLGFALLITAPTCLFIAGLICLIGLRTVARDMQAVQEHSQEN